MKKITLVCVGKLKFPGLKQACDELEKRLNHYTDFRVIELKGLTHNPREQEGPLFEAVLSKASPSHQFFALDEQGQGLSTVQWASKIETLRDRGTTEIFFLIGGSHGLASTLLKKAHATFSLGPQTLSHELARLVLTEQLYRSLSYLAGHPYHHE